MGFDPDIGKATRWKKVQPSPNPGGRPKSRLLSEALHAQLGQIKPGDPDGRSYAEAIAANLISLACSQGHNAVTAAAEIANRLEGKPKQQLDVKDITEDISSRSTDDLLYFALHERWPEENELPAAEG